MDTPKEQTDKIEKTIAKAYQSICKAYREKFRLGVEAYKSPHKTLEDFEKDIGIVAPLVQEIHGVSDSCINDVDIGLMVLYHGLLSKYEERKIKEKRKEMKNWPLPFVETDVKNALKLIAEAEKRKKASDGMVDYYLRDASG
jgi:hypothetical protein